MSRKKKKQRSCRLKQTAKRLAAYSAAAAATAMTTQDRSANAEDVFWDIPDIEVGAVGAPTAITFNVITGATSANTSNTNPGSFRLSGADWPRIFAPAGDLYAGIVNGDSYFGGGFGGGYRYADLLSTSNAVTAGMTFGGNSGYWYSSGNSIYLSYFVDTAGIAGLRFDIEGSFHYGWAQITNIAGPGSILHGFGYNDEAGEPSHAVWTATLFADFNNDYVIDVEDWITLRDNGGTDLSGLTPEEAYLKGDLNGDFENDIDDFDLFRKTYEEANPAAGAFDAMVAAAAVPEPSSMLLLAAGAAGLGLWRRKKTR